MKHTKGKTPKHSFCQCGSCGDRFCLTHESYNCYEKPKHTKGKTPEEHIHNFIWNNRKHPKCRCGYNQSKTPPKPSELREKVGKILVEFIEKGRSFRGEKIYPFGYIEDKILSLIKQEIIGEREKWLSFFTQDIINCFIPKCTWCGKKATTQTVKGKEAQKNNERPVNWGYFCEKCYAKGLKEEEETMYG